MTTTFRIGVTRDFLKADDTLGFGDIGLDLLDESPKVEWEFLAENTTELRPDQIRGYDGLLVLASTVSAETLQGADKLAIIARFGVGYDSVDVAACNEQGVLLTITPDGVRRPVAVMALTYLLALSHKMLAKDRLVREGRWHERLDYIGMGVTGRTLGLVGLGNIGREICTLANPSAFAALPPTLSSMLPRRAPLVPNWSSSTSCCNAQTMSASAAPSPTRPITSSASASSH